MTKAKGPLHHAARLSSLWGPPLAYMAAIFVMSARSDPIPGVQLDHGTDKLAHGVAYALLGFLLARALAGTWEGVGLVRMVCLGAAVATAYGALDELHQAFVPGRHASAWDVVADGVGAVVGAFVYYRLHPLIRTRDRAGG